MHPGLQPFCTELVLGVEAHLKDLDALIEPLVKDYSYDRVVSMDKTLMRIAAYELFYMPSVPPAVSLDEAIELAKKYSTAESGKFVNGVLGKLLGQSPKANWDPASAPEEFEEQPPEPEPEPEIEITEVIAGSDEEKLARVGRWSLRSSVVPEDGKEAN